MDDEKVLLCVDDEHSILGALKRLLRKENYRVVTAMSGSEGLDVLDKEKNAVQVVVSDQRMPEMTGTEFLKIVKQRYPDTIRLVLSGYADAASIISAINEGEIYRFLSKPWEDEEFKMTIRQCFERYELLQDRRRLQTALEARNEELKELNSLLEDKLAMGVQPLPLWQQMIQQLPFPIIGLNQSLEVTLINSPAVSELQLSSPPQLGDSILSSLPETLAEKLAQAVSQARSGRLEWREKRCFLAFNPIKIDHQTEGTILVITRNG